MRMKNLQLIKSWRNLMICLHQQVSSLKKRLSSLDHLNETFVIEPSQNGGYNAAINTS